MADEGARAGEGQGGEASGAVIERGAGHLEEGGCGEGGGLIDGADEGQFENDHVQRSQK